MRASVVDSYSEIRDFLDKILESKSPHCPGLPARMLFECLRAETPCPENCPHRTDWMGPNGGS